MTADPIQRDRYYRAWEANANPENARRTFVAQYGVEPAQVTVDRGILFVGPIPEQDAAHRSHRDPRRSK